MKTLYETKADKYPELGDCNGTLAFIHRFNRLIDIMNSKSSKDALRPDNGRGNWRSDEGDEVNKSILP
jgi:hypothetical protein